MEVLRRCPLAIAQRLVHCAIALSTAVLDRVTKTMSVAPLLTNNLDNSKQKTSNLLSPAPPPYSWSLLGKSEGPAPPPSSKISRSFDLAWNPGPPAALAFYIYISAGRTTRTALSSKICAGCLRHFKLLACVSSNFWLGPNSKSTKHIITRFKTPETADHYLFIYQKLFLLSSLSNEAKIRLTLWAQPWNCIRSN